MLILLVVVLAADAGPELFAGNRLAGEVFPRKDEVVVVAVAVGRLNCETDVPDCGLLCWPWLLRPIIGLVLLL